MTMLWSSESPQTILLMKTLNLEPDSKWLRMNLQEKIGSLMTWSLKQIAVESSVAAEVAEW